MSFEFPIRMTDITIQYVCTNHAKMCISESLHFKQICHLTAARTHPEAAHIFQTVEVSALILLAC